LYGVANSTEYHQYELKEEEWRKLDDFVQKGLEPIVVENVVGLYHVRDSLNDKGPRVPNPFYLYPPQASDFLNDVSDKNYQKAGLELNQLEAFFPGEDHWVKKESELKQMEKAE
ncbi:MAG TPA: hypothetical protein VK859_05870, partial [bacterium]|nr:hypothetical protein [bacterium]